MLPTGGQTGGSFLLHIKEGDADRGYWQTMHYPTPCQTSLETGRSRDSPPLLPLGRLAQISAKSDRAFLSTRRRADYGIRGRSACLDSGVETRPALEKTAAGHHVLAQADGRRTRA